MSIQAAEQPAARSTARKLSVILGVKGISAIDLGSDVAYESLFCALYKAISKPTMNGTQHEQGYRAIFWLLGSLKFTLVLNIAAQVKTKLHDIRTQSQCRNLQ